MKLILFLASLFLFSCSSHNVDLYKDENPKINLKEFFQGDIYAHGIVQDRSRKIIQRFTVNIKATWKTDNIAILDEKFVYSDKTTSSRVWELTDVGNGNYEGRASDVLGVATGKTSGNAFYFQYYLDLPVGDTTYKVHFDDWMFLLDGKTLIARSYMSKWGINLGEVTIVMLKR